MHKHLRQIDKHQYITRLFIEIESRMDYGNVKPQV